MRHKWETTFQFWNLWWTERRLKVFCGINAFLKFVFPPQRLQSRRLQTKHLSLAVISLPSRSYSNIPFVGFFFFFPRQELFWNVDAWDLACRQASLWLTHSSKWESFLPGGAVIPVKLWISFNVPVSNACQSKCQVLTSVITWMFDAWILIFTYGFKRSLHLSFLVSLWVRIFLVTALLSSHFQ